MGSGCREVSAPKLRRCCGSGRLVDQVGYSNFVNCSIKIWRDLEFESSMYTELLIDMCDISLKDWGEMRIEKKEEELIGEILCKLTELGKIEYPDLIGLKIRSD